MNDSEELALTLLEMIGVDFGVQEYVDGSCYQGREGFK